MNFEIAISLKLFNVIHLLCLVVLISVIHMRVKQGRWSDMLLIITPDEVLMLCISSFSRGVLIYISSRRLQLLVADLVGTVT